MPTLLGSEPATKAQPEISQTPSQHPAFSAAMTNEKAISPCSEMAFLLFLF
jgi:hypothetical protein